MELNYSYNPRVQQFKQEKRVREHAQKHGALPHPHIWWDGDTDEIGEYTYTLSIEDDYMELDDMVLGTLTEYPENKDSRKVDPDEVRRYYRRTEGARICYDAELWWNPLESEECYEAYRKFGASKQVARELTDASDKWFMERRLAFGESWNYVTVGVTVTRAGVEVGSDYVGGVESDFMGNGYADDLIPELASQAKDEADHHIDNLLRAGAGLPFEDRVDHIVAAGKGDGTFIKVYRSGKREEFKSDVYPTA